MSPSGVLISKIRTYKMAETLGNRIFTYTGGSHGGLGSRWPRRWRSIVRPWDRSAMAWRATNSQRIKKAYVDFFRQHFDLFRGVRSRPDVAILHSYASMAFNNDLPWQSSMLVEQALIQAKIPFDIIFDPQLADLSRYKALILPDQECLNDAEDGIASATTWSREADWSRPSRPRSTTTGAAAAPTTASTTCSVSPRRPTARTCTPSVPIRRPFRPRLSGPLAGIVPPTPPASPATHHTLGKGRSSYLASVRPTVPKPAGASMTGDYWKLPLNAQQIVDEVRWAAGGVSLEVKGPSTLVVEPEEQPSTGRLLVHLVNYDDEAHPSIDNVQVSLKLPAAKRVQLLSPDAPSAVDAAVTPSKGGITFTVPHIRTYTSAVVEP